MTIIRGFKEETRELRKDKWNPFPCMSFPLLEVNSFGSNFQSPRLCLDHCCWWLCVHISATNLSKHFLNSFMLLASIASCCNECHNLITCLVKEYFLLFVWNLLPANFIGCPLVMRNSKSKFTVCFFHIFHDFLEVVFFTWKKIMAVSDELRDMI